jgi:hypothetical protein
MGLWRTVFLILPSYGDLHPEMYYHYIDFKVALWLELLTREGHTATLYAFIPNEYRM